MKRISLIIFVLLAGIFTSFSYAYDDHDFQVWNTDLEEFKVNNKTKIALEQEFRWGDNANEFFYQHYDIGLFYDLNKYLNVGGGYRQVYELKSGTFKAENDPYLILTMLGDLMGFKFEDRSRMEYRNFNYQNDSWRYRNKFTVKFPWKFTKMEIQPFVADEIFIGFERTITQFNQNRFSAGLSIAIIKHLKAEIYYMLQSSKGSDIWKDANVLGTKLKLSF